MDNELTETLSLSPDGCDTETEVFHTTKLSDAAVCFPETAIEPSEEDEDSLADPSVRRKARYRPVDGRTIKTTLFRALDDGGQQELNAVLIDFSAGGARVFADECVPFEEPVGLLINFDGRRRVDVTGQIRWIRGAEGGGALLGLSLTPQPSQALLDDLSREGILERRDANRLRYGRKASVQWESSLSDEAVVVRDVSSEGLSLRCEIPPQVGRRGVIRLRLASGEQAAITVEVRWQSHDGDSAVIGCAIQDGPVELLLEDAAREFAAIKLRARKPSHPWIARAAWAYVGTCGLLGAIAAWSLLAGLPKPESRPPEPLLPITPVAAPVESDATGEDDAANVGTNLREPVVEAAVVAREELDEDSPKATLAAQAKPSIEAAEEAPAWGDPLTAAAVSDESAGEPQPAAAPDAPSEPQPAQLDPTQPPAPTYDRLAPEAHYLAAHELYLADRKAEAAGELITALRLERLRPLSEESWTKLTTDLAEPGRTWLAEQRAAMLGRDRR